MKFIPYCNEQGILLPNYVGDWLNGTHLARVINAVVNRLDLSAIEAKYNEEGRPAYYPRMLLKVIFYGYSTGTRSSRKINQKLGTDLAYIYLSGHQHPDFRTISDFRKNNLDILHNLFVQVVVLCKQMGIVKLGHVALDGTRIKGSASRKRTKGKEKLEEEIQRLKQEISQIFKEAQRIDDEEDKEDTGKDSDIPDELNKKQELLKRLEDAYKVLQELGLDKVNITDSEARFQKTEYGIKPGYNGQCIVDDAQQVIVAEELTTNPGDTELLKPMVEQLEKNIGACPEKLSVDGGYYDGENIAYLESKGIDGYIPSNKTDEDNSGEGHKFTKETFKYNSREDIYICPLNKVLGLKGSRIKKDKTHRPKKVWLYECNDCIDCRSRDKCLNTSKKSRMRIIQRDGYEENRQRMEIKMAMKVSKEIYSRRAYTIEPVFGHLKEGLGYRQFLLRGRKGAGGEFSLMCIAHNIIKIGGILKNMVLKSTFGPKLRYSVHFFTKKLFYRIFFQNFVLN